MSKNIAVILSGCGFLDGAEIRESVLSLLALDMEGASYEIFAPNKKQLHIIDHLKCEEAQGSKRNVLEESARIARGKISDLKEFAIDDFDALLMPGGFGVAKNLSTFAMQGSEATVDPEVLKVVEEFHTHKKPIGAICIAPALIALCLGSHKPTLTIGDDQSTAMEIQKLGAKHINCSVNECVTDQQNKIVTTPAYMYEDAKMNDIFTGIQKLVQTLLNF